MNKDLGINTRSGEIKQRVTPHLILGIFVVLVGIIFLLDNLEILRAGDYLRYWPTILIVIGLSKLAQSRETPGRAAGVVFTLAGTFLLLNELRFLKLEIWDYWPLILVVIGISMIWQAIFRRGVEVKEGQPDPSGVVNGFAFLSGFKRTCNSPNFRRGELTAIMGGCEVDLRPASIADGEAVIQAFAFWGGVEIRVPPDWTVMMSTLSERLSSTQSIICGSLLARSVWRRPSRESGKHCAYRKFRPCNWPLPLGPLGNFSNEFSFGTALASMLFPSTRSTISKPRTTTYPSKARERTI